MRPSGFSTHKTRSDVKNRADVVNAVHWLLPMFWRVSFFFLGNVAQMVERLLEAQQAVGSIPTVTTKINFQKRCK